MQRLRICLILFAFIAQALFSAQAGAITLGTYQKSGEIVVDAGSYAAAEILFWSTGNETYSVGIEPVRQPDGWYVVAAPKRFELGEGIEYPRKEQIFLPSLGAPVGARLVSVVVSVPESAGPGEYEIALQAVAGSGEGILSVAQARVFNFKVRVQNAASVSAKDGGKKPPADFEESGQGIVAVRGPASAQENPARSRPLLLALAAATILYFSWRIAAKR